MTTAPETPRYGAQGRKFFCFRFDGRRARNKQSYPIPVCKQAQFSVRIKQISVTEEESVKIASQVRQQDRKLIRQKKEKQLRAQKELRALLVEEARAKLN